MIISQRWRKMSSKFKFYILLKTWFILLVKIIILIMGWCKKYQKLPPLLNITCFIKWTLYVFCGKVHGDLVSCSDANCWTWLRYISFESYKIVVVVTMSTQAVSHPLSQWPLSQNLGSESLRVKPWEWNMLMECLCELTTWTDQWLVSSVSDPEWRQHPSATGRNGKGKH